jgi:hypothetical protein
VLGNESTNWDGVAQQKPKESRRGRRGGRRRRRYYSTCEKRGKAIGVEKLSDESEATEIGVSLPAPNGRSSGV